MMPDIQTASPIRSPPRYFSSFGNHIVGNVMYRNGSFGNPTNGDLANAALPYPTNNCFSGNNNLNGGKPTSSRHNLQNPSVAGVCGQPWNPNTQQGVPENSWCPE